MSEESTQQWLKRLKTADPGKTPAEVAKQALAFPLISARMDTQTMSAIWASILDLPDISMHEPWRRTALSLMSERAVTEEVFREAAAKAIWEHSKAGKPIPLELASLATDFVRGTTSPKRPRGAEADPLRAKAIAGAVAEVMRVFPKIKATRSPATEKDCACSIVADQLVELNKKDKRFPVIGESAVVQIWKRAKKAGKKGTEF